MLRDDGYVRMCEHMSMCVCLCVCGRMWGWHLQRVRTTRLLPVVFAPPYMKRLLISPMDMRGHGLIGALLRKEGGEARRVSRVGRLM